MQSLRHLIRETLAYLYVQLHTPPFTEPRPQRELREMGLELEREWQAYRDALDDTPDN